MNIEVIGLSYAYGSDGPSAVAALRDITLNIPAGQTVGLLGATGSGKSTLVQHFNGLLPVQEGSIRFGDQVIMKGTSLSREIRQKIGLVFQFAEFGFFEETVFDEVAFSPRQWDWSDESVAEGTTDVLEEIGFPVGMANSRSPFQLSGGQQRMVALSSVLVMRPEVLILDEPTVGLDAPTRDRISRIIRLSQGNNKTVIVISHDMDFVAPLVDRVVILKDGQVLKDGLAFPILSNIELLDHAGLECPAIIRYRSELENAGVSIAHESLDISEVKRQLAFR